MSTEMRKPIKIRMDTIHLDPVSTAPYETREQQARIEKMAKSLKERGQFEPIIVNEDFSVIWSGHTRYLAAKKLNWQFIEAVVMSSQEWAAYVFSNGARI